MEFMVSLVPMAEGEAWPSHGGGWRMRRDARHRARWGQASLASLSFAKGRTRDSGSAPSTTAHTQPEQGEAQFGGLRRGAASAWKVSLSVAVESVQY